MGRHGYSSRGGRPHFSPRAGRSRQHGRDRDSGGTSGMLRPKRRGGCLEILLAALILLVFVALYQGGCFDTIKARYGWAGDSDDRVESPGDLPREMPPTPAHTK